jgi:hypothetical protein
MPKKHITFRVDEKTIETLRWIKEARGFDSLTKAFEEAVELIRLLFDENLTVEMAIKPSWMKILLKDPEARKTTPFSDVLRTIPEMKKLLVEAQIKWPDYSRVQPLTSPSPPSKKEKYPQGQ